MKNRKVFPALVLVLLALSVTCVFPNLDTELFTRSKPQVADLAGDYVLTESTLSFLRDEGGYETSDSALTLSADGSFTLVDMPDWWGASSEEPAGGFNSGYGTWELSQEQTWWEILLDFDSEDPPTGLTNVPLAGEAPPYALWFYIGDPDSGDVIIFEQVVAK